MKNYIFIINPKSGDGKALKVWKKLRDELEQRKVHYTSAVTEYAGHAEELAKQLVSKQIEEKISVIAVGGDGTIHEVINGLKSYPEVPIGYIPAGSGNDFARGFGISKSPIKALHQILEAGNQAEKYDVGHYSLKNKDQNKRSFINGVGIGFDGDVAKITNQSRYKMFLNKLKLGSLAYVVSVIRLLFKYKTKHVSITIDGQKKEYPGVWLIAITNIAYYGGGMKITPDAKPDDGKLNLCIVHQLNRWKLLLIFGTVFLGMHGRFKEVSLLEGRTIHVHCDQPMTIHADGEIIGTTPVSIQIEPGTQSIC